MITSDGLRDEEVRSMRKMTIKLVFDVDARVERVQFLLREKGNKQRLRIDTVGDTRWEGAR